LKKKTKGVVDQESKLRTTLLTMEAILDYVATKEKERKKDDDKEIEGMPEAERVYKLLWDNVNDVRTTHYGFDENDKRNLATEKLLPRLLNAELKKSMRLTKLSQQVAKGELESLGSDDDLKEIMEYWGGDKLQEKFDFAKDDVIKNLGAEYVDKELMTLAESVLADVHKAQRRKMNLLWRLLLPVLPEMAISMFLIFTHAALRLVFHQIKYWMMPLELAVKGDWVGARAILVRIFFGHVIIDFVGTIFDCCFERAKAQVGLNVRSGVMESILRQDYEYFDKNPPGVLQERLNRDADMIGDHLLEYPREMIERTTCIVMALFLCYQQTPSDMFFVAVLPLGPVITVQYFMEKWFRRMDERMRKLGEDSASSTTEVLQEVKTVRQFAMESKSARSYKSNVSLVADLIEQVRVTTCTVGNFFGLSIYGGLVFTTYIGAIRVSKGEMMMSEVMDTVFKLNFEVVFNLREIIQKLPKMSKLLLPLGRIADLLESHPKIEPKSDEVAGECPKRFTGLIEFEDVHFSYPKDPRKPVLKGLTFKVEPGQKVALIGHTGCGKSSTMSLLQRLYEPTKGVIKIDGKPLKDYDIRYLRQRIVIVDQFTVLFAMSVRDNITYGMQGVPDEEVEKACKEAAAWGFLEEKPDKLMTQVAVGGSNFSGGQRQRIAIARAIVRKPDVILLDEATASLDNENEKLVQQALDKLAKHGSSLVIAHRLSTIKDSDKIVVVGEGRCVEQGTHDQLLANSLGEAADEELPPPIELQRVASETTPKNADTDAPPPPKLSLARGTTFHGLAVPSEEKSCTYKKLWNASTGAQEKMTVKQMQEKINKMEEELSALKRRASSMQKTTASLRESGSLMRPPEGLTLDRSASGNPQEELLSTPAPINLARQSSATSLGMTMRHRG